MECIFLMMVRKHILFMSNQTEDRKGPFNFSFQVQDHALAPFTHLRLFNGHNEIQAEGYGNMNIQLPKGLYHLRIEVNEHVEDRNYRVIADVQDYLAQVQTVSAIPIQGISSTHEYFSEPTKEWSKKTTVGGVDIDECSFFLLLRYSDNEKPFQEIKDHGCGFFILNENRELIYTLDSTNTRTYSGRAIEYFGCVVFSALLSYGQYYLVYNSKTLKREIPVYIFQNWQTQLYLMIKNIPCFNTLRISIERDGFSMDSDQNKQLDALIQKMYNGIYFLPPELITYAGHGKWSNPMLGILASYMYLLTNDTKEDELFQTILHNLQDRILRNKMAPDLVALRLLHAVHFKKEIPREALPAPCMIAAGMNAFLKQSFENEGLIAKNSIVEKAFNNLRCDSIWTAYDPLPLKKKKEEKAQKGIAYEKSESLSYSTIKEIGVVAGQKALPANYKFNPDKDWITTTIFNLLLEGSKKLDIKTLASQMQITGNTVRSAIKKLKSNKLETIANSILENKNNNNKTDIKQAMGNVSDNLKNIKI